MAQALGLLRWDADDDRDLKDTYGALKDNRGKSIVGLQEDFCKEYLVWLTKETGSYRVLSGLQLVPLEDRRRIGAGPMWKKVSPFFDALPGFSCWHGERWWWESRNGAGAPCWRRPCRCTSGKSLSGDHSPQISLWKIWNFSGEAPFLWTWNPVPEDGWPGDFWERRPTPPKRGKPLWRSGGARGGDAAVWKHRVTVLSPGVRCRASDPGRGLCHASKSAGPHRPGASPHHCGQGSAHPLQFWTLPLVRPCREKSRERMENGTF